MNVGTTMRIRHTIPTQFFPVMFSALFTLVLALTAAAQEKIAFTSNQSGNNEIWLMNPNGTNQVNLTQNPADDSDPALSRNGRNIAFVSGRDGNLEIYVMNTVGAFQTRITNNAADDFDPVFSPDGSKIAFTSSRDGNDEIYIMNVDGTNVVRLTTNPGEDVQPTFSPDGTRIIFASLGGIGSHLYSMNADGTNQVLLTNFTGEISGQASFSPDGQKIVFSSIRVLAGHTDPEIYVMNSDGSNQVRLTFNPANDLEPVFSPDSSTIAFRSERDGNPEIYTMDATGANQQRITFGGTGINNFAPSWSSVPTVNIDIPDDLAAEQGATLTVPINVTDTSGMRVISFDFALNYDPAVLQPLAVPYDKTGTLSAGFEINAGTSTPGRIVISGFGPAPLTGFGTLLKLKFNVLGTPPTSTDLILNPFTFNEGIPFAQVTGGRVFVQGTINGTVLYGTSASLLGVPNVSLFGAGSPNVSTTTGSDGTYHLGGFGPGVYTVTPSKSGDISGITALDASLISQFLVLSTSLTSNQQAAGDVSGNGTLTSFDAALIAQYVVGLMPDSGNTGAWRFLPPSRGYTAVGNEIAQNYTALLMGEVSGNWTASLAASQSSLKTAESNSKLTVADSSSPQHQVTRSRSGLVTVTLPSLKVGQNQAITIPVALKFVGTAAIQAYQFDMIYDPRVLQLEVTAVDTSGTLSSGLAVVTNGLQPGQLRLAVYGTNSISSSGTLLNIKFRVIGPIGSSSNLVFNGLMLNEGDPGATGNNGKVTVRR